jgi:hypothetical protein
MPFAGMGVAFKTVVSGYKCLAYRSFAGTFFLAYRNRYNFHYLDPIFDDQNKTVWIIGPP